MSAAFDNAYLSGAGGDISVSDIPSEGISLLAEMNDGVAGSAETIVSRYNNGTDMEATAIKLTSTVMRVYWFAYLRHGEDSQLLEWFYGATEHCIHCETLAGQVHTRAQWREFMDSSGIFPRSANLECTGLFCQCGLQPTTAPENGGFV